MPIVKIFSWLLVRNKLNTRARLAKFIYGIVNVCPLCNSDAEDTNHLIHSCVKAVPAWNLDGLLPKQANY